MTYIDRIKALVGDHVGKPASDIDDNAALAGERDPNAATVAGLAAYVEKRAMDGAMKAMDGVEAAMERVSFGGTNNLNTFPVPPAGAVDVEPMEGLEQSEPDYVSMSPDQFATAVGFDAQRWTDAFMQIACFDNPLGRKLREFPHGDRGDLYGIMFGWFANAIQAGHDYARNNPVLIDGSGVDGVSFTKKPVTIEAVEFVGLVDGVATFNRPELPAWLVDALSAPEGTKGAAWIDYASFETVTFSIGTLEGTHVASPGDWIIRGVKGEIYPCKPDIFAMTYDPTWTEVKA